MRTLGPSKPDKPMVVHCSAGIGRTGVLTAMHSILECHVDRRLVDVQQTVSRMRQQREGMVQTQLQYKFCYEAVAEALAPSKDDDSNVEHENFRPMSIPPPPYSENATLNQPMDTSIESSLPSPPSSGHTTPIKRALVDSCTSADLSAVTVEPVSFAPVEKGGSERRRKSGVSAAQVLVEVAVNEQEPDQFIGLPGLIVTAPSVDGLHQTVLEEPHPRADTVSTKVASPPQSPPSAPPESPPPVPPELAPVPPESLPPVPQESSPDYSHSDPLNNDLLPEHPQPCPQATFPSSPEVPADLPPEPPNTLPPIEPSESSKPNISEVSSPATPTNEPTSVNQSPAKEPKLMAPEEETPNQEDESGFVLGDDDEPDEEKDDATGFSIGDDQILIQKPYKKEDSKITKSDKKPQWKSQSAKAGPSLGKWRQQQQKWREKQEDTSHSSSGQKTPVQHTWVYKKKQEEQKAAAITGLAEKSEEKSVKSAAPVERQQENVSSRSQQAEAKAIRKIKIPTAFGGPLLMSSPAPPLKSVSHTTTLPPMVEVAVDKSLSSHPTPPSSPSMAGKRLGLSSTTEQEKDEGDTSVMRRIKELQKKSGASSSLVSGPVYKLPIKKITEGSPEKPTTSPTSSPTSTTHSIAGKATADSSSHSADTSTGNVARLLARFQ